MVINGEDQQYRTIIGCKRQQLETITSVEYPGSIIANDGGMEQGVVRRMRKFTNIYYALNRTLFGKNEIDKMKIRVYNTTALPSAPYASEAWTL